VLCPHPVHHADVGRGYLRVFDDSTFDLLASYQLGPNEIPNAVASMSFGGSNGSSDAAATGGPGSSAAAVPALGNNRDEEPPQYFIVGTAVIRPNVRLRGGCFGLSGRYEQHAQNTQQAAQYLSSSMLLTPTPSCAR